MVNFATEGPGIKPENETWRPDGAYGHEWGMRGPAWVDNNVFSDAMDYIDVNITRAVQASQVPGVRGYHRRIFANRRDETYLIWDDVNAPKMSDCAHATYNLHVVTQLGWPGVVGCRNHSRWENCSDVAVAVSFYLYFAVFFRPFLISFLWCFYPHAPKYICLNHNAFTTSTSMSLLECTALNDMTLGVTVVKTPLGVPARACVFTCMCM